MDPLAIDLERAARLGRERATSDAAATARRTTGSGLDRAMADTAEHTLFTEAILSAARARFAEIKTVTK
jgi:hypothetical protein